MIQAVVLREDGPGPRVLSAARVAVVRARQEEPRVVDGERPRAVGEPVLSVSRTSAYRLSGLHELIAK